MNKEQISSMYDSIDEKELKDIMNNIVFEKVKTDKDDINDDGESRFIESMYSGKQSYGYTDYKEHRKDNLKELSELCKVAIMDSYGQRGNFYSNNGEPVKKMYVNGYSGGYTGYFQYANGKTGFDK